jgi:hypothetical protein
MIFVRLEQFDDTFARDIFRRRTRMASRCSEALRLCLTGPRRIVGRIA